MPKSNIHVGLNAHRLTDDGLSTDREKAFAEQWQAEQEQHLLAYLLGENNQRGLVSDRDAAVAATVIQWLGSNVGNGFLERVRTTIAARKTANVDA